MKGENNRQDLIITNLIDCIKVFLFSGIQGKNDEKMYYLQAIELLE